MLVSYKCYPIHQIVGRTYSYMCYKINSGVESARVQGYAQFSFAFYLTDLSHFPLLSQVPCSSFLSSVGLLYTFAVSLDSLVMFCIPSWELLSSDLLLNDF